MALLLPIDHAGFTPAYWRIVNPSVDYLTRRAQLTFVVYNDKAYRDAGGLNVPGVMRVVRLDGDAFDAIFDPVKTGQTKLFDACYAAALADRQFVGASAD